MNFPCPLPGRFLPHVEHKIEAAGEPTLVLGGAYQQLLAEQTVFRVLRLARKIELRGQQPPRGRRDLDVKMARAALVSARHDGAKAIASLGIRADMAAQTKAGIVVVTLSVSLPQIEEPIRHRFAAAREHKSNEFDRLSCHAGLDQFGAFGR